MRSYTWRQIVESMLLVELVLTSKLNIPKEAVFYTGDILTQYDDCNGIPSYQSTVPQDMNTIGANPVTSIAARKLAEIVANAVDDDREIGTTIPERIDVEQTWMGSNYITSKELIESQKAILAAAVISYLSVNHNALSFPEAKCRRDIGMLVDAITRCSKPY